MFQIYFDGELAVLATRDNDFESVDEAQAFVDELVAARARVLEARGNRFPGHLEAYRASHVVSEGPPQQAVAVRVEHAPVELDEPPPPPKRKR